MIKKCLIQSVSLFRLCGTATPCYCLITTTDTTLIELHELQPIFNTLNTNVLVVEASLSLFRTSIPYPLS